MVPAYQWWRGGGEREVSSLYNYVYNIPKDITYKERDNDRDSTVRGVAKVTLHSKRFHSRAEGSNWYMGLVRIKYRSKQLGMAKTSPKTLWQLVHLSHLMIFLLEIQNLQEKKYNF